MHLPPVSPRPTTALRAIVLTGALLMAAATLAVPATAAAAAATDPNSVDLGRAAPFAVLAGAGVAATGSSQVTGDVGAYPRPAIADKLDAGVHGEVHHGGLVAELAQADLAHAYAKAAGATPTRAGLGNTIGDGGTIGDASLVAGIYAFTGDSVSLRGQLVLDGRGDRDSTWIFQVPSYLVTAAYSTINLVNGAQACNVFWQVGGTATLGTDSVFAGTVLATTAVTVESGVTVDGRVLTAGLVSLGGNTIVLPVCTASSPVAAVIAADPAIAGAAVPAAATSAARAATRTDGRPSILPFAALAALLLAALLGEPRRGRRPAAAAW